MTESRIPRLGVNIDHIATLRQLRGTPYPNLVEAAAMVEESGGQQITIHLREDRRHIQDQDVKDLRKSLKVPMNLEMALSEPIIKLAIRVKPEWVCLVPEKRAELTTEGGLDVKKKKRKILQTVERFHRAGIKVSLFIEPSQQAVKIAAEVGADAVELHTGTYCLATQSTKATSKAKALREFDRVKKAALLGKKLGLHVHAGHGIDYENIRSLVDLVDEDSEALIEEFNIGHSIVCRAAEVGLPRAVKEMKSAVVAP